MIIIKRGETDKRCLEQLNRLKPVQFTCNKCGCVYVCNRNEYKSSQAKWPEGMTVYLSGCPDCGSVIQSQERLDAKYWKVLREVFENETSRM